MKPIQIAITGYHAHVYFQPETRAAADGLRSLIGDQLSGRLRYHGDLISRPIGPHPLPMFEIDFLPQHFAEVVNFLMQNHGQLSVLIHPETGDDLRDHTIHALWLGAQLALNLSEL